MKGYKNPERILSEILPGIANVCKLNQMMLRKLKLHICIIIVKTFQKNERTCKPKKAYEQDWNGTLATN